MTDISKVVRFRCPTCGAAEHSRERRPNGNSKCVAGHSYPSRDAIDSSANRLESATTPAAINPASVDNQFTYSPIEPPYRLTPAITTDGHAGVALDPEGSYTYYNDYATLARQLALVTESRDMAKGIIDALAAEMKAAGVALIDYKVVNTRADELARQLAEAKVDTAKWKSLSDAAQIGINVQHKREVRLQSQLAEATRRLGEVEGLVGKWRKEDLNRPFDHIANMRADELEAALTKEPTK